MKVTRQIGSFQTKSDTGESYTVIELQEFDSVLTGTGTITEIEGAKRWQTSTGVAVTRIDAQTYRIKTTQEIIRKIKAS